MEWHHPPVGGTVLENDFPKHLESNKHTKLFFFLNMNAHTHTHRVCGTTYVCVCVINSKTCNYNGKHSPPHAHSAVMWSNGSLCVTVAAPEGRPSVRLFHRRHCRSLPGGAFTCTMRTHAHKIDLDESTLSCRGQCGVSWRLPNREISSPGTNCLCTQLLPVTFFPSSPCWYIFDPDTPRYVEMKQFVLFMTTSISQPNISH